MPMTSSQMLIWGFNWATSMAANIFKGKSLIARDVDVVVGG